MVQPPHILLERDRINDTVVEAVVYGALKFGAWKYLSQSFGLYSMQSFGAILATYPRNVGGANSSEAAKPVYICSVTVIWLEYWVFSADQSNSEDTGGRKFKFPVNYLQHTGDQFLSLVWWGGNNPETSHKLGVICTLLFTVLVYQSLSWSN